MFLRDGGGHSKISRAKFKRLECKFRMIEIGLRGLIDRGSYGVYNPCERILEVGNVVYRISNTKRHTRKVEEWIDKGLVVEGHVNKYKEKREKI